MPDPNLTMTREQAIPLFEAVELRHSTRSYTGDALAPEIRTKLLDFLTNGWEPYPGTHTRAVLIEGTDQTNSIFKGFLGSYGKVTNAPALIAFIADLEEPCFYEATGYMGEQCVLYATAIGLESCWVGGFFRPEEAARLIGLGKNERVLAVAALGTAKQGSMTSLYEGLFKFGSTNRGKRKGLEDIHYLEDIAPPRWFFRALEAVQVAPSSFNKQPWHIMHHKDGRISLSATEEYKEKAPLFPGAPNSSRLCCGIAMVHFRVATRALGMEGRWMPEPEFGNPIASFYIPQALQDDLDALNGLGVVK
ncbi:nitroreductase family protein [Tumebacillus permanentifrigoris]|uniref:Nitroreductase n=1 Tax=Tumebacillus permanentifrigoris TaxID=378543 RepID=A0A316DVP3_9BACL|nr:nitroreductase family protein [Tumebacillus permanentifrigoris]PWK13415.1 nitroreductase [Tumebacillus permanentifrigoris]